MAWRDLGVGELLEREGRREGASIPSGSGIGQRNTGGAGNGVVGRGDVATRDMIRAALTRMEGPEGGSNGSVAGGGSGVIGRG